MSAEPPVAEHNLARKRMLELERSVDQLRKDGRRQHELVSQIGNDVKTMVSELDLRRAVGLAFQEVEARLEDVFQDSNRKCLAMFSKREDITNLEAALGKKVNWQEYNTVLKKLSDLRQYVDTMAGSVFIGHREALNAEFAKKADASTIDKALKTKADVGDVNDVRARLERLEALVAATTARQTAQLDEFKAFSSEMAERDNTRLQGLIAEQAKSIQALRNDSASIVGRLKNVDGALGGVEDMRSKIAEEARLLKDREERVASTLAAMQGQLSRTTTASAQTQRDLEGLGSEVKELRDFSSHRLTGLSQQGETHKERLDFLMQATEMMKRKSRELVKSNVTKFDELTTEQTKAASQLAALEKSVKKQDQDVRTLEKRAIKADGGGGGGTIAMSLKALMAPGFAEYGCESFQEDPNRNLKSVLDQLEQIGAGGHPFEQMGVDIDWQRPPLPFDKTARGTDIYGSLAGQSPIDSARGRGFSTSVGAAPASVRASSAFDPRKAAHSAGGKTPRKNKAG